MADVVVLIEEQRAAMRDAERELAEATAAKADLEKKISHLQWMLERLKRLYSLTSTMAQDEAAHTRPRLPIQALVEKPHATNGRPGTVKQAIIDVLREQRRQMVPRDIWAILQKRGIRINSERPVEVVASTMRASISRNQNIFTRDGSAFGLVEWQGARAT